MKKRRDKGSLRRRRKRSGAPERLEARELLAADFYPAAQIATVTPSTTADGIMFAFGEQTGVGPTSAYVKIDISAVDADFDFATVRLKPQSMAPTSVTLKHAGSGWAPSVITRIDRPIDLGDIHTWTPSLGQDEFIDVTDEVRDVLAFGDLNEDGQYTRADIEAFELALKRPDAFEAQFGKSIVAPSILDRADANLDGVVSIEDFDDFLAAHGTMRSDVTLDGSVGFADFLAVSPLLGNLSAAHESDISYFDGDLDLDNKATFADFLLFSNNNGKSADPYQREISFELTASGNGWANFHPTTGFDFLVSDLKPTDLDADVDGIADSDEAAIFGTSSNPNTGFDTDGDLISDQIELRTNGLDPRVNNDDPSTFVNEATQGDLDGDQLSNLNEIIHGTGLDTADTDRDGTTDGDEVEQGSDPSSDADQGEAPAEEAVVEVNLFVGDPEGSTSERYEMVVGDISHQSQTFGGIADADYEFAKGKTYEIELFHRGTNRSTPDYDWRADIQLAGGETAMIVLEDNHNVNSTSIDGLNNPGILGSYKWNNDFITEFPAAGEKAYLHIPRVDLDVENVSEADDRTVAMGLNNDDDNGNGIPDAIDPTADLIVVNGDDDLLEVTIRELLPDRLANEPGHLKLNYGLGVRVWKDNERRERVVSNQTKFELAETTVFVEKTANGATDIVLEYYPEFTSDEFSVPNSDRARAIDTLTVATFPVKPINAKLKYKTVNQINSYRQIALDADGDGDIDLGLDPDGDGLDAAGNPADRIEEDFWYHREKKWTNSGDLVFSGAGQRNALGEYSFVGALSHNIHYDATRYDVTDAKYMLGYIAEGTKLTSSTRIHQFPENGKYPVQVAVLVAGLKQKPFVPGDAGVALAIGPLELSTDGFAIGAGFGVFDGLEVGLEIGVSVNPTTQPTTLFPGGSPDIALGMVIAADGQVARLGKDYVGGFSTPIPGTWNYNGNGRYIRTEKRPHQRTVFW